MLLASARCKPLALAAHSRSLCPRSSAGAEQGSICRCRCHLLLARTPRSTTWAIEKCTSPKTKTAGRSGRIPSSYAWRPAHSPSSLRRVNKWLLIILRFPSILASSAAPSCTSGAASAGLRAWCPSTCVPARKKYNFEVSTVNNERSIHAQSHYWALA